MVEVGFAFTIGSDINEPMRQDFAVTMEEMGYNAMWIPGFVSREIHGYDQLDILSALAVRTKRIKLGTIILQVPLYHPVDLARRVVTVDHLSNGRFIFGVGVGGHPDEFDHMGVPYATRGRRTDECLEIMRRLWTEEEVNFKGEFYNLKGVVQKPKPIQKPFPKILVGGGFHGSAARFAPGAGLSGGYASPWLRRAARWDGWMPGGPMTLSEKDAESLKQGMLQIKATAQANGRTIRDEDFEVTVACFGLFNVNEDKKQAHREVEAWYNARVARGYHQVQGNPSLEGLEKSGGYGPPEGVAKVLNNWLRLMRDVPAAKRIAILFASLNPLQQLERFDKYVRPLLELETKPAAAAGGHRG